MSPTPFAPQRRTWLRSLGAWLAAWPVLGLARTGPPTPSQVEGPFYPVEPIPVRQNLRQVGARAARGEALGLSGQVWLAGRPLAGARVEIWQCDAAGVYRHPRQGGAAVDPGFAGFGAQLSDAEGRYAFETLLPVPYGSRPPHIHVRVKQGERELLTTQIYLEGQTEERGWLRSMPGMAGPRDQLSMRPRPRSGALGQAARFDLVLAG